MDIIIDANCFISALLKESISRSLLISPKISFFAPENLLSEIEEHIAEFSEKTGIDEELLRLAANFLSSHVNIIPSDEFEHYKEQAKNIMEPIDINDAPYIALALSREIPVWSNDKHFKEQDKVKVFTTSELIKVIGV